VFKEGNTVVHSGDTFRLGTHTVTASATDAAGNTSSESFTITVAGTSSLVIAPSDKAQKPAPFVESRHDEAQLTRSGQIHFTDPVGTDQPTASIASQTLVFEDKFGRPKHLDDRVAAILKADFSISAEPGNANSGVIDWKYRVADKLVDRLLAAGETLTLTTVVKIDNHHGGSDTATITITFVGKHGQDEHDRRESDDHHHRLDHDKPRINWDFPLADRSPFCDIGQRAETPTWLNDFVNNLGKDKASHDPNAGIRIRI
jgi:hypothetical protein